jgi:hypothetical protein
VTLPPFPQFCSDVLGLDTRTRQGVIAFMGALDGDPLSVEQIKLVEPHTGRPYVHRAGGYPQGILQAGRQGGKSESCGARLTYRAASATVAGHRGRWYVAVGQDHRAGQRALLGHIKTFMDRPLLRPLVRRVTADTIELEGGNTIVVMPCRPASWRGLAVHEFVMDEVAHFRSSENLALDLECWRSALPTLAMTGGKLVALSSPYLSSGLIWDLHRRYYGKPDAGLLYWVASGPAMNPKLDAKFLEHLREVDAEGARAEIDGEFLQNTSALLDEDALMAAVDVGVASRPPEPGVTYAAFMDWATGSKAGGDAATIAIGHRDRQSVAVLDAVGVWRPPFSPSQVAEDAAALCARYDVRTVVGDRFAAGFSDEACRRAGLTYQQSDQDRSAVYLSFASALNAGQIRLLDSPDLLRELRGLERRRGTTKDRVDHRAGAHDDVANSAAGVLAKLAYRARTMCGSAYYPFLDV